MKNSENIKPEVGQIWLAGNTPFEITGYSDEGKMVWCQNLNSGTRWGEGLGNFERGDYKRLKPKKKIVIKELGKQLIDAEDYIVCLENKIAELKSKLNTEPQRTQSEHKDNDTQRKKIEQLIVDIYSKGYYCEETVEIFNLFIEEKLIITDTKTGEKYKPEDYLLNGLPMKITNTIVWQIINNPKNRSYTDQIRYENTRNKIFSFRNSPFHDITQMPVLIGKIEFFYTRGNIQSEFQNHTETSH